ncbi:hypothetical protein ARC20_07970 [Stenotrophomonas panacihumi]|uniref:Uncharacterized protein n=2 Tax=Stenotrophomonas panacihumi TaxID=676599 RepID=A0A0R0AIJ4_9GAMM|nr:hypothetical protein ARC20_07970 [Stenotrophomonas panacihumi]PTN54150.1 hypothetical protein C9J98_11650 [Stenotrophomonas panacihumi]
MLKGFHIEMSMVLRFPILLGAALLSGCAFLVHGPDRAPTKSEIIGTYDMGHAGFEESLELHEDGSYINTLYGHLGQDSVAFHGIWRIEGAQLYFEPVPEGQAPAIPVQAEAFFYRHKPAFVRTTDLERGKAGEWFIYQRRDESR